MKYALFNLNIIDGSYPAEIRQNQWVLVEDGLIRSVSSEKPLGDFKEIDCKNGYLVPGLINMHVHAPASGSMSKKTVSKNGLIHFVKTNPIGRMIGLSVVKKNMRDSLYSGTTTIRAVGGVGDLDSSVRDLINKGKAIGSRMFVCNEAICTEGGHMQGTVASPVHNEKEAIEAVIERKNQGVDMIKIMITGGVLDCKEVGRPGDLKMSPEIVKAICDKAHEIGLKVAAHVEGPEGMEVAIKNGVDTIEHASFAKEESIKEFGARGGAVIATISPAIPFVKLEPGVLGFDEAARINSKALLDSFVDVMDKARKNNIPLGFGTDVGCPLVTHYNAWMEIKYANLFLKDFDLGYALHSMTQVNANILGLGDKIGTIEEGKIADMVLLKENPLKNIETFASPLMVIKDGKIYTKKVKKNKKIEEKLSLIKD